MFIVQAAINFFINYAFEILTVLWVVAVTRSLLFWINYIQIKQYRPDRIFSELKTQSFFKLVFSQYRSILIGFYITWQLLLRTSVSSQIGAFDILLIAIILFFLLHAVRTIRQLSTQELQIPTFTPKVAILLTGLALLELYIVSLYSFWPEHLLIIEIIQPFIVLGTFLILYFPNFFLQLRLMRKARALRDQMKNLIVIGITGSYGKTSVKEILAHILSTKFTTLKTPKHINVDTGIAQILLDKLEPSHEVLIVEMGAYRKGEIKRICDIIAPEYGILTAVANQHLELFGSQEALTKAKFELADAVNDEKKLIANHDSPILVKEAKRRELSFVYYGTHPDANYLIDQIKFDAEGTTFLLSETSVRIPLFGRAHAINTIAAIAMAKQLGMTMKEIQSALMNLPVIERTMELKHAPSKALLVDDTYNVNTDGTIMAMEDVSQTTGYSTKILVFKELLELADQTDEELRRIATIASKLFDYIVLMPSTQRGQIRSLLIEAGFSADHILHPKNKEAFHELLNDKTVVLFEGRGTEALLNQAMLP